MISYYTGILGSVVTTSWGFDLQALYSGVEQTEDDPLIAPFTEGEAKKAVRGMNAVSEPGPDELGPSFYAAAWDMTKGV